MENKKGYWLSALNIRPNEWWMVKKLFLLQFLQGAGLAFFFTSAYALFLDRVGITKLPYVFIYSAFLLWIAGFVYSKLEHKYSAGKLSIIVTLFMAISMLFFRLAFQVTNSDWFLYIMLAWFNVLYLLNNLEFWGLAAQLFDVRQSKRLFSVVSSGDIPAKFIGYSLALLTVEYIGTINLLWAGTACMLASIPFLNSVKKSGQLIEHKHEDKHVVKNAHPKVTALAKNFAGNLLIRRLAVLTVIISTCFIIINYAFYAGVKEAYKGDVSLAKFIAFFLAFVRIVAMIVKIIFTGRLMNRLGIIKSLLITPVVMLLMIGFVLVVQKVPGNTKIIIYLFGVTAIAVEILRSAINTPVFLTIMQPLPTHERLRAHTIVKGIMDPFASLFSGILLLVLFQFQQSDGVLASLYYVLFALGIVWIIGIYQVNNQYLKTILQTISSSFFNRQQFAINDADTLKWLKEKIKSGTETEVINILKLLDASKNELFHELVLISLQNPSQKIITEALHLIQQKNIPVSTDILLPLLKTSDNSHIKAAIIQTLCKMGIGNDIVLPYLENKDPEIIQAVLTGIINCGDGQNQERANEYLQEWINSTQARERKTAAIILGELKGNHYSRQILILMQDENEDVRKAALTAAGKTSDPLLLQKLVEVINTDEKDVLQSLFLSGENSLPFIEKAITGRAATQLQKEKLINLTGRIGGSKAHELLINLLSDQTPLYKSVTKALFRSHYSATGWQKKVLENKARNLLTHSAGIVYMQNRLQNKKDRYQLLINSLQIELTDLREALLNLFAMLYNRDEISKVRYAYFSGKKVNIINAMEIIDMIVRKDLAVHFNIINEPGDILNRMAELHKLYPDPFFENVEHVLIRILSEDEYAYHYWTMACSLYTSKKQQHTVGIKLVEKYVEAENLLLRETARYVS